MTLAFNTVTSIDIMIWVIGIYLLRVVIGKWPWEVMR